MISTLLTTACALFALGEPASNERQEQASFMRSHTTESPQTASDNTPPATNQDTLGPAERDVIYRRGNASIKCIINTETTDDVRYSIPGTAGPLASVRWSTIDHIVYARMETGAWTKGNEVRQRGEYESAADLFHQLASSGKREWEKVMGSFAEGECLELAGKPEQAIDAFDIIVQNYAGNPNAKPPVPRQRMWIEALYRKGLCLALVKKTAEAQKIAASLFEIGKKETMTPADVRANGILAVAAVLSDNPMKFKEYYGKAAFNPARETDAWFHFKFIVAEKLRVVAKKPEAALGVYTDIQKELQKLSFSRDRQVQVTLGLGLAYADNDKKSLAITELLKIDVMAYGSAEQQCLARATAARLMWEEVKKLSGDAEAMKSPRTAEWVNELQTTARFTAHAAADGPANCPSVEDAKSLLATMK